MLDKAPTDNTKPAHTLHFKLTSRRGCPGFGRQHLFPVSFEEDAALDNNNPVCEAPAHIPMSVCNNCRSRASVQLLCTGKEYKLQAICFPGNQPQLILEVGSLVQLFILSLSICPSHLNRCGDRFNDTLFS